MKKNDFNKNLFNFINSATCSFNCIDTIKNNLLEEGYVQLYENEKKKTKYATGVHVGLLFIQPQARNLQRKPCFEECRHSVQADYGQNGK